MIRAAILSLALSGCAPPPYDPDVAECQRQSPPWLAADCQKGGRP